VDTSRTINSSPIRTWFDSRRRVGPDANDSAGLARAFVSRVRPRLPDPGGKNEEPVWRVVVAAQVPAGVLQQRLELRRSQDVVVAQSTPVPGG
jgi:hypothetical protein